MKDMSKATYILRVKIDRDRSKKLLFLSQETYIKRILERFNMSDCKPMATPISKGQTLSLKMCPKTPEELKAMARVLYSSAVGTLMYVMMCTRPYIYYAVRLMSKYQSNVGRQH